MHFTTEKERWNWIQNDVKVELEGLNRRSQESWEITKIRCPRENLKSKSKLIWKNQSKKHSRFEFWNWNHSFGCFHLGEKN